MRFSHSPTLGGSRLVSGGVPRTRAFGSEGMSDRAETQQRLALLRATVEALPQTWPTDPLHCRSRGMLARIVALLTASVEQPAKRA